MLIRNAILLLVTLSLSFGPLTVESSTTCQSDPQWKGIIDLIDGTLYYDESLLESTQSKQADFLPPSQDEFLKSSIEYNPGLLVAATAAMMTMWTMGLAAPITVPVAVVGMIGAGTTIPAHLLILTVRQKQKERRAAKFLSSLDPNPSAPASLHSARALDSTQISRYLNDYLTSTSNRLERLTRALDEFTAEDLRSENVDPVTFRYYVLEAKMTIYQERIAKLRSLRQFVGAHCHSLKLDRLRQ